MKLIEKITDDGDKLFFEKYSRADVRELIYDAYAEGKTIYDDFVIIWELDDGTCGEFSLNKVSKKPSIARIKKFWVDNYGSSEGFFGKEITIEKNNDYGDWEVVGV